MLTAGSAPWVATTCPSATTAIRVSPRAKGSTAAPSRSTESREPITPIGSPSAWSLARTGMVRAITCASGAVRAFETPGSPSLSDRSTASLNAEWDWNWVGSSPVLATRLPCGPKQKEAVEIGVRPAELIECVFGRSRVHATHAVDTRQLLQHLLIVSECGPQHAGDDLGGRGLRVEDLIATGIGRLGDDHRDHDQQRQQACGRKQDQAIPQRQTSRQIPHSVGGRRSG